MASSERASWTEASGGGSERVGVRGRVWVSERGVGESVCVGGSERVGESGA
jgi:hypothetical protein